MPAPSESFIEQTLISQMVGQGLTKKIYNADGRLEDSGVLTDDALKMVKANANALAIIWQTWQAQQVVVAEDTITTNPVLGTAGLALP
jgi:hypothetical protein